MVTGDYYHTALAVARGVGMLQPHARLVVIQTHAERRGTSCKKPKATPVPLTASKPAHHKRVTRSVSFAARPTALNTSSADEDSDRTSGHLQRPLAEAESVLENDQSLHAASTRHAESAGTAGSAPHADAAMLDRLPSEALAESAGRAVLSLDSCLQTAVGNGSEGIALCLDNGDMYQDGDVVKAFSTISEVSHI